MSALPVNITAERGWIHGVALDLTILVGPWLLVGALWAARGGGDASAALWLSQFVLGNTTHVVLTFVLLAARGDVLRATPSQARVVVVGSLLTFALSWALFRGVKAAIPDWTDFALAVAAVFGTHHRLSQAKGIWSLYNLRGAQLSRPAPSARERALQQHWVSVGLLLVMVAWLFVPSGPSRSFPLLQAIPREPAFLPYATAYLLAAVWLAFVAALLVELARSRPRSAPKVLHVATHGAAVTLAILAPVWGSIVWGAIHGLEYYFLCARMMRPREGDAAPGPSARWVWPLMLLSMSPLFLVGLALSPHATLSVLPPRWSDEALILVNALVMAHYFADAFIYRFRIPEVRRVALRRLGFA
ncbi:hypothetical protein [Sorangium sp. So ce1182]|uniref:hypothetical protein n=1 Tax=Sorangium sp. So ce1182 TaxID=3133334 RepID=UPI003F5F2CC2